MIIQLEIPKELEDDYQKDKLGKYFERVYTGAHFGEAYSYFLGDTTYTLDSYVAQMLADAFKESKPISWHCQNSRRRMMSKDEKPYVIFCNTKTTDVVPSEYVEDGKAIMIKKEDLKIKPSEIKFSFED